MSDSDRSLIVAGIFGLAAIAFGAGLTLGGDWAGKSYEQTEKPYASARNYAASDVPETFAAYPIAESNRCYAAKNHDSADLCAQWRAAIAAEKSANAAMWANRLSILGALLSAFGLAFLLKSLRQTEQALEEARDSNKISRQMAEIEHRPEIYISSVEISVRKYERDRKAGLRHYGFMEISNEGQSRAIIEMFQVELAAMSADRDMMGGGGITGDVYNRILASGETMRVPLGGAYIRPSAQYKSVVQFTLYLGLLIKQQTGASHPETIMLRSDFIRPGFKPQKIAFYPEVHRDGWGEDFWELQRALDERKAKQKS